MSDIGVSDNESVSDPVTLIGQLDIEVQGLKVSIERARIKLILFEED